MSIDIDITIYGAYWCPDCRRAKQFLGEQFIPFKWVDIEQDKAGEQYVLERNHGKRIIPTVVFGDGSVLVEPTNAELATKLGLQTEAKYPYYDLMIVGGGPAGLTAAIYAAREGNQVVVIERAGLGGQAALAVSLDNFPGFPEGINGLEFCDRIVAQARRFGVEILQAQDVAMCGLHNSFQCVINAAGKHVHGKALLLASGARYRRLGVPGEDEYLGAGIHYCATCDGPFYKGAAELVVVGAGNSAVEEALHLTRYTDKVTLLARGDRLTASQIAIDEVLNPSSHVAVRYHTVVEAFEGRASRLTGIRVRQLDTGAVEVLNPAAAFIFIGQLPNAEFAKEYVQRDLYGYVLTGADLPRGPGPNDRQPGMFAASAPGVFAAGDVRHGSVKQVASAVGEGAGAAIAIRDYLKTV